MKLKRLFTVLALANVLIISMALSIAGIAYAQDPPEVQSIYPPRNAVTATLDTAVSASYNQPMSAATVSSVTFALHGMQSGLVTETHGVILSNTLIVTPVHAFHQGELVYAIATTHTENITGATSLSATQWQFNAGVIKDRCVAGFTDIGAVLTGVMFSSAAWGDYDNDGDLDILLAGADSDSTAIAEIYKNDGGAFSRDAAASAALIDVAYSSVVWGDYDNDGDLDILLTGSPEGVVTAVSEIYENNNGIFSPINPGLPAVYRGSVAWGDYDNDGDLDILLTGEDNVSTLHAEVYRNDSGAFNVSNVLTGVRNSSVAWGDYDNDGDLDILITGEDSSTLIAEIYQNNGGTFNRSGVLTGVAFSSVAWGDYDNDSDLDILLTGQGLSAPYAELYQNNGGVFTLDVTASNALIDVAGSSVDWGDYDNDGDLDILLAGDEGFNGPLTVIYENNGGDFTVFTPSTVLTDVYFGSVDWGDYDNDGDLDMILSGAYSSALYDFGHSLKLGWKGQNWFLPVPPVKVGRLKSQTANRELYRGLTGGYWAPFSTLTHKRVASLRHQSRLDCTRLSINQPRIVSD